MFVFIRDKQGDRFMKKQSQPTAEDKREFRKLFREVNKSLSGLHRVEKNAYASIINQYVKMHNLYKKNGTYTELMNIIMFIHQRGYDGNPNYKQLGNYGYDLVCRNLYPESEDETEFAINLIAIHRILRYLRNEE